MQLYVCHLHYENNMIMKIIMNFKFKSGKIFYLHKQVHGFHQDHVHVNLTI